MADLLPVNALGEEIAKACYEAGRDAFLEIQRDGWSAYMAKRARK